MKNLSLLKAMSLLGQWICSHRSDTLVREAMSVAIQQANPVSEEEKIQNGGHKFGLFNQTDVTAKLGATKQSH